MLLRFIVNIILSFILEARAILDTDKIKRLIKRCTPRGYIMTIRDEVRKTTCRFKDIVPFRGLAKP